MPDTTTPDQLAAIRERALMTMGGLSSDPTAYIRSAKDVPRLLAMLADRETELEKLRSSCRTLGHIVVQMSRGMRAAVIEDQQNGSSAGMQWILNSLPDLDDNDPADHWDGKESAAEWLERTRHLEGLRD